MKRQRIRLFSLLVFGFVGLGVSRCSSSGSDSSDEDGDAGASLDGGASGSAGSAGNSEAGAPEGGSAGAARGGSPATGGSITMGGSGGSMSGGSTGEGGEGDGGETSGGGGTMSAGAGGTGGVGGVSGAGGNSGGAGTSGASGAAGMAGMAGTAGACPTAGGEMARLPPGYCMDLTEVTIAHYSAWIATNPVASPATQIARCASNLNFPPNPICMEDPEFNLGDEYPQSCVDWCDAYAFCQAMGKRLCGRIGGGETPYADFREVTVSQWHNACTSGGVNIYSFDGNYEDFTCNGQDYQWRSGWVGPLWTSPEQPGCHSTVPGYERVGALSGNVAEWEDSCAEVGGGRHRCRVRGGSYLSVSTALRCDSIDDEFADDLHASVGFRCCAY